MLCVVKQSVSTGTNEKSARIARLRVAAAILAIPILGGLGAGFADKPGLVVGILLGSALFAWANHKKSGHDAP